MLVPPSKWAQEYPIFRWGICLSLGDRLLLEKKRSKSIDLQCEGLDWFNGSLPLKLLYWILRLDEQFGDRFLGGVDGFSGLEQMVTMPGVGLKAQKIWTWVWVRCFTQKEVGTPWSMNIERDLWRLDLGLRFKINLLVSWPIHRGWLVDQVIFLSSSWYWFSLLGLNWGEWFCCWGIGIPSFGGGD